MPSAYSKRVAAAEKRAKLRLLAGAVVIILGGAAVFFAWSGNDAGRMTAAVVPPVATPAPATTVAAPVRAPAPAAQLVQGDAADAIARTLDAATLTQTFATLLNGARADEGLGPLMPNTVLEQASFGHAQDMETLDFFAHESQDGRTLADRARAAGYRYCQVAENIARGQRTVREVHEGWMNSPGHRANNLLPDITEFGIVMVDDTWVLMLGKSGC